MTCVEPEALSTLGPGSSSQSQCPCRLVPPPLCVRRGQKSGLDHKGKPWVRLVVGRGVHGSGWHSHNWVAGRLLHRVLVTSCPIIFTMASRVPEKGGGPETRWHSRYHLGTGTGAPEHHCSTRGASIWPSRGSRVCKGASAYWPPRGT